VWVLVELAAILNNLEETALSPVAEKALFGGTKRIQTNTSLAPLY
jgi:hypothetical protein